MRRSDMIDLMTKSWKQYVTSLKSPDDAGVRKGMDYVLKKIETAGMLPPSSTVINGVIFEPKWDKEDESTS